MNTVTNYQPKIRWGAYEDRVLEQEYQESSYDSMRKLSRPIILMLSSVFMLFIVGDILGTPSTFFKILPVRILISLLLVYFYLRIPKLKKPRDFYLFLSLCELSVSISFLYISSLYETPEYLLRILTLVLMIFAYFIIPNYFLYSLFNTTFIWVLFLITSYMGGLVTTPKEWAIGLIFPSLFLMSVMFFHLRLEIEKRYQYITNKILIELSTKDTLTKINNRSKFEDDITSYMKQISATDRTFTFVILDIDDFKKINDQYGHLCGDSVLIELSSIIDKTIRKQDVLARWGGEEFVIFFPDTPLMDAISIINRIKDTINQHTFTNDLFVTCSFGVTEFQASDSISRIVGRADKLLYQAKSQGKNKIIYS